MVSQCIRNYIEHMDNTDIRDTIEIVQKATPSHFQILTRAFVWKDILFSSWADMGRFDTDIGRSTPCFAAPPDDLQCYGIVSERLGRQRGHWPENDRASRVSGHAQAHEALVLTRTALCGIRLME